MGGISPGPGRGRRQAQSDLNLVPFIDLFSTIIIFLLSVAVWDQLAAVPINLGAEDKASIETPKDVKKVTSNVRITVKTDRIETFEEGKTESYAKVEGQDFDYSPIEAFVADMRQKYVDKKDMLIYATDQSVYEDIVAVMDRCLAQEFDELIVTGLEQQ